MDDSNGLFIDYVHQALAEVTDRNLVEALLDGFINHADLLDDYTQRYQYMTSRPWSTDALCTFFCGWRSPDGAAHAVASIIVRILQLSKSTPTVQSRLQLLEAARHCGEIIVEDVGLGRCITTRTIRSCTNAWPRQFAGRTTGACRIVT
ncbi:hypothetical protein ACFSVK_11715 [Azorhizophilus paspali]|uniref:hypothetical protein n=1 Tax=Azorhizophilus paspali TaxID=69963 RepID=UPI003626C112